MKTLALSFICAAGALCAPTGASAATLWDNGNSGVIGNWCDNNGPGCSLNGWTVYDDFQLTNSASISGFSYLSAVNISYASTNWSIWTQDPRTAFAAGPAFSGTAVGSITTATSGISKVVVSGLNVTLGSGTYWLGLQNNLTSNTHSTYVTSGTAKLGSAFQLENGGRNYNGNIPDAAFTIAGALTPAVPEPASWAMMILGMGAIGFAMRRHAQVRTAVRFA